VRSFLIDAGASNAGYACDITRTYSHDTSDEFQALIDAVDVAQRAMCDQVRNGVDYRRLHLDAHLSLSRILRDFGLVTVSPEVAVETGVSSAFFPHGIGHGIGLQVHDVPGSPNPIAAAACQARRPPYLRLTRTLAPGMAVTIEPGIYFIDMLLEQLNDRGLGPSVDWGRVDAFRPYGGIRIEDDVVCTDDAPLNLTREAFAEG
jgi:Xaa-Pro dipeptidase